MRVYGVATYLSQPGLAWREGDYTAYALVKALKQQPFKAQGTILTPDGPRRIAPDAASTAPSIWASLVADGVERAAPPGMVLLIPIPNSSTTTASGTAPTTLAMATALAGRLRREVKVADILRFTDSMKSAQRGGGTRDARILYQALTCTAAASPTRPCILVDDVMTTGGHLQACAARLRSRGANVALAAVAALTVHDQSMPPVGAWDREVTDIRPPERSPFWRGDGPRRWRRT